LFSEDDGLDLNEKAFLGVFLVMYLDVEDLTDDGAGVPDIGVSV